MNIINQTGLKLIEFKDEFGKDYPDIVKDSLTIALRKMVESGEIDRDAFDVVTSSNSNRKMFIEYLQSRKEYCKTPAELRKEFEKFRMQLDELLAGLSVNDITTEVAPEKQALLAIKTFSMDSEFVMDYFGVAEKDLLKLMKKGGFVEVFVSLRLSRVLSYILEDCSPGMSHIRLAYSLPYLSSTGDGYNIDLMMEVNVDDFLQVEWRERILSEIKEVSERAGTVFFQKMTI